MVYLRYYVAHAQEHNVNLPEYYDILYTRIHSKENFSLSQAQHSNVQAHIVEQCGQTSFFPEANKFSRWNPRAKKPLLAILLETNKQISISVTTLIKKRQITNFIELCTDYGRVTYSNSSLLARVTFARNAANMEIANSEVWRPL
jgi:hypothetical protein